MVVNIGYADNYLSAAVLLLLLLLLCCVRDRQWWVIGGWTLAMLTVSCLHTSLPVNHSTRLFLVLMRRIIFYHCLMCSLVIFKLLLLGASNARDVDCCDRWSHGVVCLSVSLSVTHQHRPKQLNGVGPAWVEESWGTGNILLDGCANPSAGRGFCLLWKRGEGDSMQFEDSEVLSVSCDRITNIYFL